MVGIFVLILIGFVITYWYLVVAALALYGCGCVAATVGRRHRLAQADRLRHAWAREEIDQIALDASRAMFDAALGHGEVIDGTSTELR
jgi:hypothetical protein